MKIGKQDYVLERNEQVENKELLKQIRLETGMSQKRFACYFKIPVRTYEDWEGGVRKMLEYLLCLMTYKLRVEGIIERIPDRLAGETNDE